MRTRPWGPVTLFLSVLTLLCVTPAFAQSYEQTGKLKIHVSLKQAYVFIDGKAIRDGSQTIALPAGDHQVGVYNYGFHPKSQKVHIVAGETTDFDVTLTSYGGEVSGPFADIEFKGDRRAAVLLNGKTPDYFVGHVDEFDWNWLWHQRLLVQPGTYQVTVTREGKTIWSGPVTAKVGQMVTVYLDQNGQMKTKDWRQGLTMGPQPRFHAGVANAIVPIAPVTAKLTAQSTNLNCGQSTSLDWNSTDAVDTSINGLGKVPDHGDRSVTPSSSTKYVLTAIGPGGEATPAVAVNVNTAPTATLSLSRPEVRYHKIGEKVVEQDPATLDWSASNANSARIDPFGTEPLAGSTKVLADPRRSDAGPVDENISYQLTATNACGGIITKTAMLHVVGSIDPPPAITLASMFFPTAYPTKRHPKVGLVASETTTLTELANHLKDYEQYEPKTSLVINGYTDVRGSRKYNQSLSDRRANLVKDFLVSHGIPADKVQVRAMSKDHQLNEAKVAGLQSQDPQKPEKWMRGQKKTTWLAYNRRADIVLEPKDQASTDEYPNDVANARLLWQRPIPGLKRVEKAAGAAITVASLR